jgi:mRNA (2'-O-methyladenosine-N6-)-methyltransferase
VGVKGNSSWLARGLDCDVIVGCTRDKSHKPDELYEIAERLSGSASRKLELFGREHNIRPGWLTVGNQLNGINVVEPEMASRLAEWQKEHSA